MSDVDVIFVLKKNAKAAKCALDSVGWLNKDYRMCRPVVVEAAAAATESELHHDCIALPVTDNFDVDTFIAKNNNDFTIVDIGRQVCPYSTKVLGNHRESSVKSVCGQKLTLVQQAIVNTVAILNQQQQQQEKDGNNHNNSNEEEMTTVSKMMIEDMKRLDRIICPHKLEIFGDDKTIVIPQKAFDGDKFHSFILKSYGNGNNNDRNNRLNNFLLELWKQLAICHGSPRAVRRGAINKESGIRESGHRLLFPTTSGIPDETGPGSPGWTTVTEQGIRQSFDMTRVMFSRGNISEKIRFGKLVQEGEVVLDMYAGIGYYTLPALIIGNASHCTSCEWNSFAATALQYNIQDNHVQQNRSTILIGDCRVLAKEHDLSNKFDRVSLGLLPSSEGGWSTALQCIRSDTGGWLHIHGNVPVKEMDIWALWVVHKLKTLDTQQQQTNFKSSWVVICNHVEKVKSFAPTVAHYVADVYVGPADNFSSDKQVSIREGNVGVIVNSQFLSCPQVVEPPSCALSPNSVLSQEWMR